MINSQWVSYLISMEECFFSRNLKLRKYSLKSGMKNIKSESVDIIICDPPYNIGKNFGNNGMSAVKLEPEC